METESVAKRAIALIETALLTPRATLRSDEIAEALKVDGSIISARLDPYVKNGTLLACKVERPGGGVAVNEYKISSGGKQPGFRQYKAPKTARARSQTPAAPAAAAEAPAKAKRAKKRRAPVHKVQKTVLSAKRPRVARKVAKLHNPRADLRIPYADAPAGTFRTAIASDGAMLFLGAAAGPFELSRPESRALIEFVRTLDRGEVGA